MIDAWTGPTPLSNQFPHNEPNGIRKLLDKIKSIETELRDVRSHLPGSGITTPMLADAAITAPKLSVPVADSITTAQTTADSKTLGFAQPTTPPLTGRTYGDTWIDTANGNKPYTWDGAWVERLVGNDALSSPIVPDIANLRIGNFAMPNTNTEILGVDLVVPANCTRLLVNAATWVSATNTSTTSGSFAVATKLSGLDDLGNPILIEGDAYLTVAAVGARGTVSAPIAALVESLPPGGTIRLFAIESATSAWTADILNVATLTATLMWLR